MYAFVVKYTTEIPVIRISPQLDIHTPPRRDLHSPPVPAACYLCRAHDIPTRLQTTPGRPFLPRPRANAPRVQSPAWWPAARPTSRPPPPPPVVVARRQSPACAAHPWSSAARDPPPPCGCPAAPQLPASAPPPLVPIPALTLNPPEWLLCTNLQKCTNTIYSRLACSRARRLPTIKTPADPCRARTTNNNQRTDCTPTTCGRGQTKRSCPSFRD